MDIDDLTYGELKQISAMFQQSDHVKTEDHGIALVVADRGHVWVGDVETGPVWATIKNARIVRYWGTDKGLNQLANNGPLEKTILDDEAEVLKVSMKAVIAVIPCNETSWKK